MAILFHCPWPTADAWLEALQAALPDQAFRVWPDLGRPEAIDFAFVFQPPAGALAGLPGLRGIASLGAGVDTLLADPTIPPELPICRLVDPLMADRMAEYVAGQVLGFHLRLPEYRAQQAARAWQRLPQTDAGDRTVGILGLGQLGRRCAQVLRGLGFRIIGWRRGPEGLDGIDVRTDLDAVLRASDILVCLAPLTAATQGLLDCARLARLPRGAAVINVARGGLLVEADLLAALDEGRLSGAALDVFDTEPLPPAHPYWSHPKVQVTPHISSLSAVASGARILAAQYRRLQRGEPMTDLVDRAAGY
jgi:glyoxylate/hydroxypyruvate reductase A